MSNDTILKVILPIITAGILATAGWVWNTHSNVQLLEIKAQTIKEDLEDLEVNQKKMNEDVLSSQKRIYAMEHDIGYIKEGIDDIKEELKEIRQQQQQQQQQRSVNPVK